MKCPIDGAELVMSDRQGIEIDYCPQCRGVWLDRGELDKIIERSLGDNVVAQQPAAPQRREPPRDEYRRDYDDDDYKSKKRKSFIGDLFDF